MNIQIITTPLTIDIHGFSGIAINKDYVGMAFKLMDKMWHIVKSNNIKNKGMNIWVYENNHGVFSGVELDEVPTQDIGMERKKITIPKYGYYKHIGSYTLLKQSIGNMKDELQQKGYEITLPHIEIYGHWTEDESKLETELLMSLK